MELNQGRPSEREQVLWYEPLDAQWQRLPMELNFVITEV